MSSLKIITGYLPLAVCISCAGTPVILDGMVSDGIILRVSASSQLNRYRNEPHTVLLVCYQLTGRESFSRALLAPEGVEKLLSAKDIDPSVVTHVSLVVQPGEEGEMKMNLLAGTKYFGVVAGYFQRTRQEMYARIYKTTLYSDPTPLWQARHVPHILIDLVLEENGIAAPRLAKTESPSLDDNHRMEINY